MSSKLPPEPLVCEICGDFFYARKDAKTCSRKCRQRKKYLEDKRRNEEEN